MAFPFVKQFDAMDCGPACLKMIAAYYKRNYSLDYLRKRCYITKDGVSFLGLSEAADSAGFRTIGVKMPVRYPQGEGYPAMHCTLETESFCRCL